MNIPQITQRHAHNFLDLPPEIRVRIYNIAGLLVGANLRLTPREVDTFLDWQPSLASLHFTYNILQTCKAINAEVMALICSQNTLIVVHEYVHYGLRFLRRLNPQQCSSLTDLFVQLHLEAPVLDSEVVDEMQLSSSPKSLHRILLTSWQATAKHILSHTTPRTLSLRLFCDTGLSHSTFAVLQPLREFPGVLKDCELQLHHQKGNTRIRAIAWEASTRAKGFDPGLWDRPFRFFDLPTDIRRYILEYSDLVTPAARGFRIATARIKCGGEDCDTHLHNGCRFLFCAQPSSMATGYICCRHRSGYSSRCQCWVAPRALLLANGSLCREALQVLYSCSRVVVVPSEGLRSSLRLDGTVTRLDASRFITRHMWPDILHNLRTIEFVLPAVDPASNLVPGELFYLDLCFAIDHLKAHADIPKLTIVVIITSAVSLTGSTQKFLTSELLNGSKALILRAYVQLLDCLKTLRCMRRFFVHLEWASRWSMDNRHVSSQDFNEFDWEFRTVESWLEKMVMGHEYNSEIAAKIDDQPSI
ncbi:hypothetical protein F4781DRAFT_425092 [Annulohypoxylon bovei var. microspora]|nr:hypothetical protein F4781DRAFT_425092 [Annulohypoxylon bovei var. microspora]